MKKIVIANFKSHLSKQNIIDYLNEFKNYNFDNLELIFCPSNIYLGYFIDNNFITGSQDVSVFSSGSYTGETTSYQLNTAGVKYGIVGHSERRINFDEDNYVASKLANLISMDINPVLCIGETLTERQKGNLFPVIERQLDEAFIEINNIDINKIVIAYEPIWSIGTNKTPTNTDIEEVISYINDYIQTKYDASVKVVYGGSVNLENIADLRLIPNLDGYLIGGASINLNDYIELLNKINFDSNINY